MKSSSPALRRYWCPLCAIWCALILVPAAWGGVFPGVSIKVTNEVVPPGGTLQMKVWLTEPKPIVRGSTFVAFDTSSLGTLQGVALFDPTGSVSGAAVSTAGGMRISFSSPLATFGTVVDYPLITMVFPIPAGAQRGRSTTMAVDPSISMWLDATGIPYPQETKAGVLKIAGQVSISNVFPGGGSPLPAGSVVTISGIGFDSTAKVSIEDIAIASTNVVNANRIDVTLAQGAVLDGKRLRVTTSTDADTYYCYLRTSALGSSSRPLLVATDPIFARQSIHQGTVPVQQTSTTFTALALQNSSPTSTIVVVELLAGGVVNSSYALVLPGYSKFVREVSEILPASADGMTVRVTSQAPIQMLGLLADSGAEFVVPVPVSTVVP